MDEDVRDDYREELCHDRRISRQEHPDDDDQVKRKKMPNESRVRRDFRKRLQKHMTFLAENKLSIRMGGSIGQRKANLDFRKRGKDEVQIKEF